MGASIIALALHNKYSLHLPLYRQIKGFERIGLEGLSEGVLCNWVRAADAGQRAAIIYTMVEECKRTGTDFQRWLMEVLRRLPTHRASEGYLSLMPGILEITSEDKGGKKVSL